MFMYRVRLICHCFCSVRRGVSTTISATIGASLTAAVFGALLVGGIPSAGAADQAVEAPIPTPRTLEEADAQRKRASELREAADARFAEEEQACYKKFLANKCVDEARTRYRQSVIYARKLDIPAREFQREARRAEVDGKTAKRVAEQPARDAERQQQIEDFHAETSTKAAERKAKLEEKARQAEEGRLKRAQERADYEERKKDWARKDAERAARKANAETKADEEAAARVPKF